jgi:hypothetical protein
MASFDAVAGVAGQKAVCLHYPIDPFEVDRRSAALFALSADQGVDAAIAVAWLTGDDRLDLGQQGRVWLRRPSAALARLRCRLLRQVRTGDAKRVRHRLRGVPSRSDEGERNSRFFGCARSSASRKISVSSVFFPSRRCSSRT